MRALTLTLTLTLTLALTLTLPPTLTLVQEMQTDPKKANAAMQDPDISAKLQKLIAAGVLQVR